MAISVKVYHNCDDTFLVWKPSKRIPNCRGFAVYRRLGNDPVGTPLPTWVGWDDENVPPGTSKPSTEWPIQRFTWSDYLAAPGQVVSYQVVPMLGTKHNLHAASNLASKWTAPVTITAKSASSGISVYFNRGIVAAQWVSRKLGNVTAKEKNRKLAKAIQTPHDPIRDLLSGELRVALLALLRDEAAAGSTIYAALFDLNDKELIESLKAFHKNANLILANGIHAKAADDENKEIRKDLQDNSDVNVFDRMLPAAHLGHNKFLVVCDLHGMPQKVWTASANWQFTGLCTQANNGLLIDNPQLADLYKQQWDRLKAAHNGFPDTLLNDNSQKKSIQVSGEPVTVWFTPTRNQVDLADATALIQKAEDGILFLLFNPGPVGIGTLLDAIIDRRTSTSQFYNPRLYIRGVLNQDLDPSGHPVAIYRDGRLVNLESDVVYPAAITKRLKFWVPELKKLDPSWAMVHSKVVILDPFGKHPVVMMGSHNMGVAASSRNDENLLIIENDRDLAEAYAVNIIAVYNQYRWRSGSAAGAVGGAPPPATSAATPAIAAAPQPSTVKDLTLTDDDLWQDSYYNARRERAKEIRFWLGQ